LDNSTEDVSFADGTALGTGGLVLEHDTQDPNSPANLVIDGGGRKVGLTGAPSGEPLITVGTGVELTLRNITFTGVADNTAALIYVNEGHLIIEEGTVITGNNSTSSDNEYAGGGVYVTGTGAFTMEGGEISGNNALRGGGVCVTDTGAFTMKNGKISGNNANNYGGGVYADKQGTLFTMKNGEIRGNTSGTQGYGGGVCVGKNGQFTKTGGGTIDDTNSAKFGKVAYMFLYAGKKRDATAGPEDDMDSSKDVDEGGGWEKWY
jgi:hypothetical protein